MVSQRANWQAASPWLEKVAALRTWERDGVRAPHKPLLLLLALGRLQRHGTSRISFEEVAEPLRGLLREFGPPRRSFHPELPFFHLQTDGLWQLGADLTVDPGRSPTSKQLIATHANGQLPPGFERALLADHNLFNAVVRDILDRSFPPSLHEDILAACGVTARMPTTRTINETARSPMFRDSVLMAYEYSCALCGYRGQLGPAFIGLDAAHVRWWSAGGPDAVDNGLSLCSLHHKLFDGGVLGVDADHRVLVSARFIGDGGTAKSMVLKYAGTTMRGPQGGTPAVAPHHLAWHRSQVFKGPARET